MEDARRQEAIRKLVRAARQRATWGLAVEEEEDAHLRGAGGRGVGERRHPLRRQQRGDEEVAGTQRDGEIEADHQVEERILVVLEVLGRPEDAQQLRAIRGKGVVKVEVLILWMLRGW